MPYQIWLILMIICIVVEINLDNVETRKHFSKTPLNKTITGFQIDCNYKWSVKDPPYLIDLHQIPTDKIMWRKCHRHHGKWKFKNIFKKLFSHKN